MNDLKLFSPTESGYFHFPVNAIEFPEYYLAIPEPMDLETLEKRVISFLLNRFIFQIFWILQLTSGIHQNLKAFAVEAELIALNCKFYNCEDSEIHLAARKFGVRAAKKITLVADRMQRYVNRRNESYDRVVLSSLGSVAWRAKSIDSSKLSFKSLPGESIIFEIRCVPFLLTFNSQRKRCITD